MAKEKTTQDFPDVALIPPPDGALIAVQQLPIITERLRDVKEEVEEAVAEAKSMVATADTVQAVKNRRAELNKQFDALEKQRKAVKEQILAPYQAFEVVYRECIADPFKLADVTLKATVDGFEAELKLATRAKLKAYYDELCQLENIDWLPFEKAMALGNIKIGMADCKAKNPQKLKDAIAAVVSTVATGIGDIQRMEDSPEIMAEYKTCLDVGRAVANVQERKRKVEEEKEAAEKRKEWEAKREAAIAKVEAAAPMAAGPTAVADPTAEERIWPEFRFTVYNCTRTQLIKIREFLKQEGIQYGK